MRESPQAVAGNRHALREAGGQLPGYGGDRLAHDLAHRVRALRHALVLGLEFQLGSDILSTAVAPTIAEIKILAAIAVIRTALNYFLSKEIERKREEVEAARRTEAANDPEHRGASG